MSVSARYIVGDVFDGLACLPDDSVDLVMTSPPFLALRSYLPANHPYKAREIGSEATPGEFIDTLLDVVEACDRVLAPHGSMCIELGDTYSGSGGAGSDYLPGGLRENQPGFTGSARASRDEIRAAAAAAAAAHWRSKNRQREAWPLDKSLCLVPEMFRFSLVYGFNPLTGRQTPRWRARNVIRWCLDGDTVVYARTPKGVGPARLLHLAQNFQPGQWELWDGQRWTHVLGWSSTAADDAIEITFRNGERISATREHQWPTNRGLLRTDELTVGDVVPIVQLPEPERTAPSRLPDEEIGWLVGTFLADGSFDSRDRIQIAGHRNESEARLRRLRELAESYDGTCTAHDVGDGNEATVVVRSPILATVIRRYVGGDGARNKHLTAATWRRSNRFLCAVISGYLAGDGYYDAKNDRWRLGFTDNIWLARDLRVLCARLGWSCRVRRLPRVADPRGDQFVGTARFYHRGDIRMLPGPLVKQDGEVVALRPSKRRRFYDIGVEGEPHLFALGSGLLTHNCRPNPPVGMLGDKFRPATSDIVVICKSRTRYFDLDGVRSDPAEVKDQRRRTTNGPKSAADPAEVLTAGYTKRVPSNPAGAPPLDWWAIPIYPYEGSHYACYPPALCEIPVEAMCPRRVCRVCGEPSRRITERSDAYATARAVIGDFNQRPRGSGAVSGSRSVLSKAAGRDIVCAENVTVGWTSCGHEDWRLGVVLDPFAGSGTTLAVATGHGRDAIGIDIDERNAELALGRVGPLLLSVERTEPVVCP